MSDPAQDQLQFLAYDKPRVESGNYRVIVTQDLTPSTVIGRKKLAEQHFDFTVLGERFSLNADAIHTVFPPAGSTGRRTDVLPHIAIKRTTFPWERSAYAGGEDKEPWVALLLFEEKEFATEEAVKQVVEAENLATKPVKLANGTTVSQLDQFPSITLEKHGQTAADLVTVINVKHKLLEKILPTWEELKLLAHIRRRKSGDNTLHDLAVVMSNRLPRAGSDSIMHLVSLEDRYDDVKKTFNYGAAGPDDYVRLVSLASWTFSSVPETGKDFEELVEDLTTGTLALPVPIGSTTGQTDAQKYLSRGFVPVPHKLRQTSTTYSWYHGPLVPYAKGTQFALDADLPKFADGLVEYDTTLGMFDSSYAAAFELGRALALEDKSFCTALYQWKLRENEKLKKAEQQQGTAKLIARTASVASTGDDPLTIKLQNWLNERALLEHIPFNYLVADERMLPEESIRFFQLDWYWIECLLYGAFTVGGYTRELESETKDLFEKFKSLATKLYALNKPTSGFILRSKLVADYPDLAVDVFSGSATATTAPAASSKLAIHRLAYLGKEVLVCLCSGVVATTELYLEPEGLRFGLDEEEDEGLVLELPMDATTTEASPDVALIQAVQVAPGGTFADGSAMGDCFQFANQSYVRLRYPNVLKTPSIRSFTMAFWMKASDLSLKANWTRIFDASWDSTNFIQWVVPEANTVQLSMKVNGTAYARKSIGLSAGVWYHIAGVWDAKNKVLCVYVNGSATDTDAGSLAATGGALNTCDLGQKSDGTARFSGSLARLSLYDRALTKGQVGALMEAGKLPKPRLLLPMDELTYDHLNRGIDRISSAELVTDTDMAYCLEFNGKNSCVKLRYLPEIFDNMATGDFTIAFRVNAKNLSVATPWTCLLEGALDSNNFVQITVPEANKLQLTVRKAGTRYQTRSETIKSGWRHIAITWKSQTNSAQLFIDGQEATVAGADEPVSVGNQSFELGRNSDGKGYFEGRIAHLRVYSRALTKAQVCAIHELDQISINTKRYEKDIDGLNDPVPMAWLIRDGGKRVVKIKVTEDTGENTGLADRIKAALGPTAVMNPAQFGMHMMEGSNKARIVKKA